MKLSILIPCYNEKDTILKVVDKIKKTDIPWKSEIIIVCDGSNDGTKELLKTNFRSADENIKVFYHEKNKGKGVAVRTAASAATGDYLIIQDADLELDPKDYVNLLKPVIDGRATVVFGSRKQQGFNKIRFLSKFANYIVTKLTNVLFNTNLTDQACGYKLLPVNLFNSLNIKSRRFELCAELTAKVLKHKSKLKITEVDVDYNPRTYGEGKKICWKDGFIIVLSLIKYKIFG